MKTRLALVFVILFAVACGTAAQPIPDAGGTPSSLPSGKAVVMGADNPEHLGYALDKPAPFGMALQNGGVEIVARKSSAPLLGERTVVDVSIRCLTAEPCIVYRANLTMVEPNQTIYKTDMPIGADDALASVTTVKNSEHIAHANVWFAVVTGTLVYSDGTNPSLFFAVTQ